MPLARLQILQEFAENLQFVPVQTSGSMEIQYSHGECGIPRHKQTGVAKLSFGTDVFFLVIICSCFFAAVAAGQMLKMLKSLSWCRRQRYHH